ncbi:MAG: hypothetical protein ACOYL5_00730 [Phototrophicaceae bacterium]
MNSTPAPTRWHAPVLLLTFLACVYLITYSGRIESTDTLFMFNAAGSFARHGDFLLDVSAGERRFWEYESAALELPLLPVDAEPIQVMMASALYALSDLVPGVGHVHTVWLFNIGVTLTAVGLFYAYVRLLGYTERVALVSAGVLGLGTVLWPYSKSFFQEPLTMLWLLLCAYLIERGRQAVPSRRWGYLVVVVALAFSTFWVRRGGILAFGGLLIYALPGINHLFHPLLRFAFFGVLIGLVAGMYPLAQLDNADKITSAFYPEIERIPWEARIEQAARNQAVHGYLFSLGGSFWGTSPVLLLALPGMIALAYRGKMREVVFVTVATASYISGYTALSGANWFGGVGWPPRFLVPIIPFVMLLTLPSWEYLLTRQRQRLWAVAWAVTLGLVLYSLWIQLSGVSYWWGEYAKHLPAAANGFTEWRGGLDDPRYFRWTILPRLWGQLPLDFAWVRTQNWQYPLVFGGLGIAALVCLIASISRPLLPSVRRFSRIVPLGLGLGVLVATGWGLRSLYHDDLYLDFSAGLWQANTTLEAELTENDILLLSSLGHERFFLNYGRLRLPRIISLPQHPGEQPSPEQPPQIISANPAAQLEMPIPQLIYTLAQTHDRLWLLSDSTPFIAWSIRPVERFMAAHYYLLGAQDLTGADGLPVHLLEYSTGAHHAPFTLEGAQIPADFRFGEAIQLTGVDLPLGESYLAGEAIPFSLQWVATNSPTEDYTITTHLVQVGGGVAASGFDSMPDAGFSPTTTWLPYAPVWDNRAIRLPASLTAGEYVLWVGVYRLKDGSPELLPVRGIDTAEGGTLAVLPIVIQIQSVAQTTQH